MATTAIVAEILIAGLEALVWISLLILLIFGVGWVDLGALDGWQALSTILVLAAAYVLGILIDRAADSGEKVVGRWSEADVKTPTSVPEMRIVVYREASGITTFVEYQRSRLRVARSTTLNLLIALPVATTFLLVRTDKGWEVVAIAVLLAIALVLSQLGYRRIEVAYLKGLSEAYRGVIGMEEAQVAAAIPYKREDGKLKFLLVRAKPEKSRKKKARANDPLNERWTFPKGHRKPDKDKTLADTARREARGEAGIAGSVDAHKVGSYPWPSDDDEDDDVMVPAYLLEVTKEQLPVKKKERMREPSWMTIEEAHQLLGQGRKKYYAECLSKTLKAAVDRLEASR